MNVEVLESFRNQIETDHRLGHKANLSKCKQKIPETKQTEMIFCTFFKDHNGMKWQGKPQKLHKYTKIKQCTFEWWN